MSESIFDELMERTDVEKSCELVGGVMVWTFSHEEWVLQLLAEA
jgi:hypothetical protein